MNDNKTIKILRIITLTLTLMLLVFALAKKVGLCASDSNNVSSVTSLPLPVGAGWGNEFSQSEIDTIVNLCIHDMESINDRDLWQIGAIVLSEKDDVSQKYRFNIYAAPGFSVSSPSDFWTSSGSNFTWSNGNNYGGCRQLILNYDFSIDQFWWKSSGGMTIDSASFFTSLPDNSIGVFSNHWYTGYPIYIIDDVTFDGVTYFSDAPHHSQGGSLTDYSEEVQNFIDSNVNDVDVSDPSNTSNVPSWLQKILSGLGTINNTIGGGFSWIKNGINNILGAISDFSDSVSDRFDSLIGKVDSILGSLSDNTTETDLYDAWVDAYEDSYIYAFIDEFSVVDAGLKNIANTQAASSVSFTFSLPSFNVPTVSGSGSVDALANHNSVTVGFNWYTLPRFSNGDSIRDRIWLPFSAFLVIGFCWRLFAKIPSILGGQSGLSDGVHKTIELSNIYANRVN